jgi:hypothetical protein
MATLLQYKAWRFTKWLRGVLAEARAPQNVTINNYFTISSNHEPSRIARDVVERISESRRYHGKPDA